MLKLTIGNSYSSLAGLTSGQHKHLSGVLSYEIPESVAFFSGGMRNRQRSLLGKRGDFPSGLLYLVKEWLKEKVFSTNDTRVTPKSTPGMFTLTLPATPYKEQVEIAGAVEQFCRGTISAVTGFGKSYAIALVIERLQVPTLVIVPNLTLKEQLKTEFLKIFGSLKNITVENIDSPKLETPDEYGLLILDECHHAAAATYRRLNRKMWSRIYYRACFTATPYRSREEERLLLESVTGKVIYEIDYKQAVAKGYVCPVEAYYVEIPKTATNAYGWAAVYSELVVNNEVRNKAVIKLLQALDANDRSTLCLVTEIAHGKRLSDNMFYFANGQDDDTKHFITLFNRRTLKTLIGTTGVVGEGVDTKPCEYVVIAGLGKSKPRFLQQVGRGIRRYTGKESCKVIIFYDKSHKFTKAHFAAQVKILKEYYGITPVKLSLL